MIFGKLFGRKSARSSSPAVDGPAPELPLKKEEAPAEPEHPAVAAMIHTIAEMRSSDPLIGAKIASKEVFHGMMKILQTEQGIHSETLFTALGALAGYSCQMGIRAECALRPDDALPFIPIVGGDNRVRYFGDALNAPLAESQYSVWSLGAGKAQQLGASLPDVHEIFTHVSRTCGTETFGVPRFPGEGSAGDLPINYIKMFLPILQPWVAKYCCAPSEWHIAYGLAIQEAMEAAKAALPPAEALTIVMESAIPMSKIDPGEIVHS